MIQREVVGMHHWSDAGVASWYDFAVAIGELAVARGLIAKAAEVLPISASEYPTPAQRPAYSLLACGATRLQLQLHPQHWRCALKEVIRNVEP